ncbi:putative allantoate permease protein [Botryosphaeria dothidea]|uniref:Putative allantoate permease protein n=1 Tax=Botryosphaeria dothidea TaxID=55169 RepID=A0A8H4IQ46_9PEZI|nr:putative allantoate permease protein [Botryosphaeria dothidea]KAF4304949.1 putative allantoate permease protein [Botryosphaeria dothidea]
MADKDELTVSPTGNDVEKSGAVDEFVIEEKSRLRIDDEVGDLAAKALTSGPVDPEMSKRVLRKIDRYILPFLCITYALQFIDKTSLGYSSVYGIIKDNNLKGQDYSWASSIFYFGYLLAEYPGVAIIQRFPVAKFLGINIILWASILMTTAACTSFAGLATVRFFLGVTEATISPGFVAITGIWWTRHEQAARSALWISFLGVGSLLGGLIAFGIGHIGTGALASWQYIFLVLGAATAAWGVLFVLVVPDGPASAGIRWLTPAERVVAVQRVVGNKTGTKSRTFVRAQVVEAAADPKVVILGLISLVNALASGGLSFGSLIIQGFGFSPIETTLMNMPLAAVQTVAQLGAGVISSKLEGSRLYVGSLAMLPPVVGTCLINGLPEANKWGRLVGLWLLGTYPVGFLVLLGLLATNVAGSTKRSVASGWVFVCYCVGQIAGPQCFKSSEAPEYRSGIVAMLCGFILNLVLNLVLRWLYVRENKKRDALLEGKSEEEIKAMEEESRVQGFENVTDKENVMFRYVL